jgi:apolipoprotein N-acyltransferase
MKNFLSWLDAGTDRRDNFVALAAGALAVFSMPPIGAFFVLFLAFPVLIRLLDKAQTGKQVFTRVFLFHFAFHVFGLYWVAYALLVDIENNWWALPLAVTALPALMALYPAALSLVWHRISFRGLPRLVLLAALLAFSEWLRGVVFTGFPWNLWGYAWTHVPAAIQSVSVIGVYGLSFITILLTFIPIFGARHKIAAGAIISVFLIALAWGQGRSLREIPADDYVVRIVQPNIKQEAKWDAEKRAHIWEQLWSLTLTPTTRPPNMIVWPETSIAIGTTEDVRIMEQATRDYLWDFAVLAAGVFEVEFDDETEKAAFFNRISFYNNQGERVAKFDKHHLVPFGEFLPFQNLWPVKPVAFAGGSMTAGDKIKTLSYDLFPKVSPLICYEVIFSGDVTDKKDRPRWMLNVTNDAWYGRTSGPYQHLDITRFRAVEEGLPLVRAANTGISAVIDPMGRVLQRLPLGGEGIIDQALPTPLKPTIFARFGNLIFFGMLIAAAVTSLVLNRTSLRKISHVA